MAPRLIPPWNLRLVRDMIERQSLTTFQVAAEAECSQATITKKSPNEQTSVRFLGQQSAYYPWRPYESNTGATFKPL
jgi:hypothetical protein